MVWLSWYHEFQGKRVKKWYLHLPMMNGVIWCRNVSMSMEGSIGTKPYVEYDPVIFLKLRFDYSDGLGLCVVFDNYTKLSKASSIQMIEPILVVWK